MNNALVKGSLSAIVQKTGQSLAESFLNVDAIILVDVSGSMSREDVPSSDGVRSRIEEAGRQLRLVQEQAPGKVAVISFSDDVQFHPDGNLRGIQGSTDMLKGLRFIKVIDGTGIRIVVISDGLPDDKAGTLAFARTFSAHIDTIYIGSPDDMRGQDFLRELSAATGGVCAGGDSKSLPLLAATVKHLLSA